MRHPVVFEWNHGRELQLYETNHLTAMKNKYCPETRVQKITIKRIDICVSSVLSFQPSSHHTYTHIHTYIHLPQNQTLHHMRCQKRIKRWWNSFMCCIRHHTFDQRPNTHLIFLSCCFSPISQLMWRENVPPWKWNRTNKWDWVCWPHFVIPHEISLLMQTQC